MTKLVKVLLIGGTSTAVAGGTAAGVGVSLTNKKSTNVTKPVAKAATKYAVPTLQTAPEAKQMAIPPVQGIKIPHMVLRPTVPAGGFVFGGRSQEAVPPLRGTYQTHEGFGHAEAIGGYLQMTPEVHPQAVPYEVPKQIVSPTVPAHGLVFGGHAQEVVPPLKGTIQTHEGIHHLALDSDMQLIPDTPAHPTLPQAVPYVVPAMQPEVYKNTLGDPYIQNEWVSYNGAAVVWTVDDHQVPFLYKAPVAPTATPSMVPGLIPTATPQQVLPEQKVPMMINNYGPISSNWYATAMGHDQYATPYQVPTQMVVTPSLKAAAPTYAIPGIKYEAPQEVLKDGERTEPTPSVSIKAPTPRLIIVPQLMVPPKADAPKYEVPSLKSVSEDASVETLSIDPASKIAPAHIVGAVNQPIFETFVGQFVRTDTMGAVYQVHEGFAHAESPAFIEAVPTAQPYIAPVIAPKLPPVVAPVLAPQESHVHSIYAGDGVKEVEQIEAPADETSVTLTAAPHDVYSHNSLLNSLLTHLHNGCSVEQSVHNVFGEVLRNQHHGYEHEDFSQIWSHLAHFGTFNQFRDAFNHAFAHVRVGQTGDAFTRIDNLHSFTLHW